MNPRGRINTLNQPIHPLLLWIAGFLLALLLAACTKVADDGKEIGLLDRVNRLPPEATTEQIRSSLPAILAGIRTVPRRDIGIVREVTVKLREQPNVTEAFTRYYDGLPADAYSERQLLLALAGELQRTDLLDLFTSVTWAPLPDAEPVQDGLSPRDREVMLQMKAVEGIGFLRDDDGTLNTEAVEELTRAVRDHPSRQVRINAIDVFMWNHGDSTDAADELKQMLDIEWHKWVERPRYHAGANLETFNKRVQEWQDKWGTP